MADSLSWRDAKLQEGGYVILDPKHVWVNYDVKD